MAGPSNVAGPGKTPPFASLDGPTIINIVLNKKSHQKETLSFWFFRSRITNYLNLGWDFFLIEILKFVYCLKFVLTISSKRRYIKYFFVFILKSAPTKSTLNLNRALRQTDFGDIRRVYYLARHRQVSLSIQPSSTSMKKSIASVEAWSLQVPWLLL